jgi:hypothetical protein
MNDSAGSRDARKSSTRRAWANVTGNSGPSYCLAAALLLYRWVYCWFYCWLRAPQFWAEVSRQWSPKDASPRFLHRPIL